MTVSSTTSKISYSGNSSTTTFVVPFYFLDNTHIKVTLRAADGTETVKTLTTDYSVTGAGVLAGGSITMTAAPATGVTVVISRNVTQTQEIDYQTNDPFPAETHERALDKLTMEIQQLQEAINRSIKLSQTNTMNSTEFTVGASTRANKVLAFDSAGELSIAQEIGTYLGNWAATTTYAQRSIVKDTSNNNVYICLTSHVSSGVQPISTNTDSAKWALLVDAATATAAQSAASASASAAATSASNASTSASNAASSASSASTSASTATTQASNASGSASAASTSASAAASSASAASASAAAAAAAAASGLYRQVLDKTANYTVVAADQGTLFRASTGSGAITFTLPQISTVTDGFKISVVKWTSDGNVVNINRAGTDTINGATSTQISSQYSQVIFVADFETNTWFASQSGLGATNKNKDRFSGNGSTTVFTLSSDPGSQLNTDVYVSGVHQTNTTYTVSGTTLTFSTAPASGTNNIEVVYGTPLAIGTPSDGTVSTAKIVDAAVTTNKIADANVTTAKLANSGNELGMRNRIINGDFRIFQRTTINTAVALTGSFTYQTADRWALAMGTTVAGISKVLSPAAYSPPTGFSNCFQVGRNSGSSSTGVIYFNQVIESANAISLQGQTVTLSFYAKAGANFSSATGMYAIINTGTGGDSNSSSANFGGWTGNAQPLIANTTITTSWVRYQFTCTLASNISNVGILLQYAPTGTAGADDNLYITGVQLEIGATATPFDYRPYVTELALCQRYCVVYSNAIDGIVRAPSFNYNTTTSVPTFTFPVPLRVAPTGIITTAASNYTVFANGTSFTPSSIAIDASSRVTCAVGATCTGLTSGHGAVLSFQAGAKLEFTGMEL